MTFPEPRRRLHSLRKKSLRFILSFRGRPFAEESLRDFNFKEKKRDSSAKGMPRNDSNFYFFRSLFSLWLSIRASDIADHGDARGLGSRTIPHRLKPATLG
jgi:hypothetical protein